MKPEILLSEAENISETIVNQRRALHRMPGTEFDLGEKYGAGTEDHDRTAHHGSARLCDAGA